VPSGPQQDGASAGWDVIVGSAFEAPAFVSSFDDVAAKNMGNVAVLENHPLRVAATEPRRLRKKSNFPFTELAI
jgi:hypothetical protein